MRPVEIAVVVAVATLALGWVGPLGWALVESAARFAY